MSAWPVAPALGVMALGAMVLVGWLGAAGFARLRTPLNRMHCVGFVVAGCFLPLLIAGLASEGVTVRTGKVAVLLVASLLGSAASAHAIGRGLLLRGSVPEEE